MSSHRKVYDRHCELVDRYQVYDSEMNWNLIALPKISFSFIYLVYDIDWTLIIGQCYTEGATCSARVDFHSEMSFISTEVFNGVHTCCFALILFVHVLCFFLGSIILICGHVFVVVYLLTTFLSYIFVFSIILKSC